MTQIDFAVLDWIQEHCSCELLNWIMPKITELGTGGVLWIIVAMALLLRKKTRYLGAGVALALLLDVLLCNLTIKPLVARARPFSLREVSLLVREPTDYSFPSGHTAASFAAAGALFFMKSRGRALAMTIATFIGLSRLYLYVHYPTDVLAGALVGLLCGFLAAWVVKKAQGRMDNMA